MNRRTDNATSAERRGMTRSTRISMIAGVAVFLTLVSGVSFAAWTASSTKSATASAGAVAVSTSTSGGAATITALGPYTYTATNQTVTKPITVRNTGSVDATVSSITVSSTGTLPAAQVAVKFWAGASAACAATTPVVSTTLGGGSVSLSTLNIVVASSGTATLCASTTFTGNITTEAGKTTTGTFALNTTAGTNWNATDSESAANRSFTQSIAPLAAPSNMQCSTSYVFWTFGGKANISWTAPAVAPGTTLTYDVYANSGAGAVLLRSVTSTSVTIDANDISVDSAITVRAVANGTIQSAASTATPVDFYGGWYGVRCGN